MASPLLFSAKSQNFHAQRLQKGVCSMFPIAARSAINAGRRYCPNLLSPTFSATSFTSSSFSPSFNVFSSFSRAFSSVGFRSASSLTWVSRISHGNNGVWGGGNSIGIGNVVGCNVGFGVGVGNGVGLRQSTETGMIVRRHLTTDGSKEPPEQRLPKARKIDNDNDSDK